MIKKLIAFYRRFNPWHSMLFAMVILTLAGIYDLGIARMLPQVLGAIAAALIIELPALKLRLNKIVFPTSALITALITATVLPFGLSWWQPAVVVAVTLLLKHLVRPGGKHIFNPAGLAVILAILLFGIEPGWWNEVYLPLTILLGIYVTYRMRKAWQVVGYLVSYLVVGFIFLLVGPNPIWSGFSLPAIFSAVPWFFTLFMIPEPRTSPISRNQSIVFGAGAALWNLLALVGFSFGGVITGLLFANLLWTIYRLATARQAVTKATQT